MSAVSNNIRQSRMRVGAACFYLLTRHKTDDVNMSSVWEYSRNDIASNISVFVAAGAAWCFQSGWPTSS
ncbi:MAG: hypothetical protein KBF52_11965 [Pyrinomonadaceae bacterium]|nr:hypothetical protein [Pyrinomonadaceae bacterium]